MSTFFTLVVLAVLAWAAFRIIRIIRKNQYFGGPEFLGHRAAMADFVTEHNDVLRYTEELRTAGTFAVGASSSGSHAHLASFQNTSQWNYRRDRNLATYQAPNVHNCSLQVVRSASAEPLKYVTKYFGIRADQPTLEQVERIGESISRLEEAVGNLKQRETAITFAINPPKFVRKHYMREFWQRSGVVLTPITVPYPVYVFEYVTARSAPASP